MPKTIARTPLQETRGQFMTVGAIAVALFIVEQVVLAWLLALSGV